MTLKRPHKLHTIGNHPMKSPLVLLALAACAVGAFAQIPGIRTPHLPGVEDLFKKGPAITTSLADAKWEAPDKDGFNPEAKPLPDLERGPNGGFILQEGAYGAVVQSYCLHAGTYGPGKGDAYLYAPPKGPAEKAVSDIAANSVAHPDIPQREIQLLLWGIIARTKFSDLSSDLQDVGRQLLTPKQIRDLDGDAMSVIGQAALDRGLVKEPPLLRRIHQAENEIREKLSAPGARYEDVEHIAVLDGVPPLGKGGRTTPSGRWSLHPDGYYVRYVPGGYSQTRLEVYVPAGCPWIGKEFDPSGHIAVPCETGRQRLLQSSRLYGR